MTHAKRRCGVSPSRVGCAGWRVKDTNVVTGTAYYYRVQVQNALSNSYSNTFVAAPRGAVRPDGLASGSSVSLRWTNNATTPAATVIWIQRATDAGFTKIINTQVGPTVTSYTDRTVVAGTTCYYRVLAQN